ncbi:hypothetical protein Esti_002333 [Eimeria stiedai]
MSDSLHPSGADEFLYLLERLVSSDQQKQPQLLQHTSPIHLYSGPQQLSPSACYYGSGSPVPSTHLQIDGREVVHSQKPCPGNSRRQPRESGDCGAETTTALQEGLAQKKDQHRVPLFRRLPSSFLNLKQKVETHAVFFQEFHQEALAGVKAGSRVP